MREASNLKIFLIAMAICAALVATLCLTFWLDAACQVEGRRIAMKNAGGVGCFEFWLNRYQSLAAAILATGVALYVVRPAFRQLEEMSRQTSKGAKEIAEAFAVSVDEEIEALDEMRRVIEYYVLLLYDFEMHETEIDEQVSEESTRVHEDIRKWLIPISRNERRRIATITINDMRGKLLAGIREFSSLTSNYVVHLRILAKSKSRSRLASANAAASLAAKRVKEVRVSLDALKAALEEISGSKWDEVRRLERKAQGIEE